MHDESKPKSKSKSVSLYPDEWEIVERITRESFKDIRSDFFRSLLAQVYPDQFDGGNGQTDNEARIQAIEAKVDNLIERIESARPNLTAAEDPANYPPEKS